MFEEPKPEPYKFETLRIRDEFVKELNRALNKGFDAG